MKTQISRSTYRPGEHYSSVRHQQGRMIVDADLNEQADIVDGRLADALAATVLSGAPAKDGWSWKLEGGKLKLLPGRLYVDGLAARLEGAADQGVGLADQPDYPGAAVPASGPYRVYADVWERSVTALEDAELMDAGLHGADTATRSRTMLQVKTRTAAALPAAKGDALLTLALNTSTTSGAGSDPCAATGPVDERIGNYLFRVEVHDIHDDSANKTHVVIKWSRDNGSEACRVGDEPPGFTQNVWSWEFFDAASEKQAGLHPSAQKVRRGVMVDGGYAIPAAGSPRSFVRQWDGHADINLADATVSGRERGTPLSSDAGGQASFDHSGGLALVLRLELLTLRLQLRTESTDHVFVPGDYWLASVREAQRDQLEQADGGVLLDQASPAGITHHYLELGSWNAGQFSAPAGVTDAAWKQALHFRPLTDLQADGMSYALPAKTAPADSLRDRLPGFREYAADQRITVQAALDALALKLDAASIPYAAGSNPARSISDLMVKKTGDTMSGDLTVNARVTVDSFRLVPPVGPPTPDKAILSYDAATGLAKWLETALTAWNLSGGNLATDSGAVTGSITIGTGTTAAAPPLCVANGRVGIGTNDPRAPLHIVANTGTGQDSAAYGMAWLWGKHIADGASRMWGLQNAYGRLVTWDSDSFFVGLQDAGSNRKDAVIAWGDDSDDRLRFLFTPPAASSTASTAPDPVEIMQLAADGSLRVGGEGGATLTGNAAVGAVFGHNVVARDAACAPATDAPFAAVQAREGALSFHTSPGEFASATDVNPRVFIDPHGNVGIGTTDTGHGRLVVDGDLYLAGRLIEGGIVALARKDIEDIHLETFGGEKKLGGTSFVLERSCEVTFNLAILTDSSTNPPIYVRLHGPALTQPLTLFDSPQVDTSGVLLRERSEQLAPGFYVLEIACASGSTNHDMKTLSVVATQKRTADRLATGIGSPVL